MSLQGYPSISEFQRLSQYPNGLRGVDLSMAWSDYVQAMMLISSSGSLDTLHGKGARLKPPKDRLLVLCAAKIAQSIGSILCL
jgi:hypothetical protein